MLSTKRQETYLSHQLHSTAPLDTLSPLTVCANKHAEQSQHRRDHVCKTKVALNSPQDTAAAFAACMFTSAAVLEARLAGDQLRRELLFLFFSRGELCMCLS